MKESTRKETATPSWPSVLQVTSRGVARSVGRGIGGPAIELRKTQNQDADSLLIGGRQHDCYAIIASEQSSCVVVEPAHAEKQHAREPGTLERLDRKGTRPVREGAKPEGGRARSGGVGPHILSMNQTNKRSDLRRSLGRKGCGPRRTSFNPTLIRHRAENECPGIGRCARSSKERRQERFTALLHM